MTGCRYCESQAPLETCPERGELICTDCGAVCNESNIVTEVSFDKDSGGPLVFGQLLYADGLTSYERRKLSKSTVGQARKRLLCLGAKLRLSSSSIETGFSFYKLAVSQGLLRGFRNSVADAVLLYITCRLEGTPHMLMDFSDILRINLFTLGRLFLKLSKALHLSLPLADPWQYILRFSAKLSLGEKRQEVARTALRLVARMKRDWMGAGRHPCGLYGAALFVSARISGICVHIQEIARTVSLHSSTIRKRLHEFERTPSCALTIDEFFRVDLSGEEEPPAFKRARKPSRAESDSDSDSDSSDSALGETRKQASVDETIAKARYLQRLREAGPLPPAPVSQRELEQFSFLDSVESADNPNRIASEDELDRTGLDEREMAQYLLSAEEVARKTEVWTSEFGEFEEERQARAERRRKLNCGKPPVSKKRRTLEVTVGPESSTREALQQVIIKTGLQSRLSVGTLLGDPAKEPEQKVELEGNKISGNGYESGDSDCARPESPLVESLFKGEDVAVEQDMYFEDYDIR